MKSDAQLQQDVLAELEWEPSINAAHIGVEVENGLVTLAGHVDSFAAKQDAEVAAQRVDGVKALVVELTVNLLKPSMRTDADLAAAAEHVLQWTTYLPADSVKVLVEKGWITLSGTVDWAYQRWSAAGALRHLLGARGVTNDIALKSSISSSDIKSDIEFALKRLAKADARKIAVYVDGSTVTLSGAAKTWAERESARIAAWSASGVHKVIDEMSIA